MIRSILVHRTSVRVSHTTFEMISYGISCIFTEHEVVHMPVSLDVTSEKSVSAFFEVLRSSFPGVGMHRLGMPPAGSRLKQAVRNKANYTNTSVFCFFRLSPVAFI